jgi:chemotaxis signal transduction protein
MPNLDFENSERFCVFQSGEACFGIPALAVRHVAPRPALTPIPQSDPILLGLGHVQNEFLPVVSLRALTQVQYEHSQELEKQLLVLIGHQGAWGLLIDQVITLAPLETSYSSFTTQEDRWSVVHVGSASYLDQFLQILDPVALYQYAAGLLEVFWQDACQVQVETGIQEVI